MIGGRVSSGSATPLLILTYCLGGRERPAWDLPMRRSTGMRRHPRATVSTPGSLPYRARMGTRMLAHLARLDQAVPQRCWAAWRVMPSREPISAHE